MSIPAAEGPLAGDYSYTYSYTDAGWAETVTLPAAGGLPAETITTSYTNLGLVNRYTSDIGGGTTYVDATSYDKTGDLVQQLLGAAGAKVSRDLAWDEATGRLDAITTITGADTPTSTTAQDDTYTYDPAGNVLSISDATAGPIGQKQCFDYDQLRRLVDAWTVTTAACGDGPSTTVVDGPDPYWHTWTFDTVGNRLTHTQHGLAGSGDTTTSYTYPTPGTAQPHALTGKSVTDPSGTVVTGYTYDQVGNTTSRPGDNSQQTLTWDPDNHLATVTDESGTTDYIYDTSGNRLITHNADGTAILYLPQGMEVHATTTGGTTCQRYYSGIATRSTTGGLTWLAADHHNTGTLAIDADDLSLVQRRTDPYGNPRGPVTSGIWPDDKGFLGATQDPTGLTHLGAREYDPTTGRFISVDPIMDLTNPQQWQAYSYANNNPVTYTDPDGLEPRPWHDPNWNNKPKQERETITATYLAGERRAIAAATVRNIIYKVQKLIGNMVRGWNTRRPAGGSSSGGGNGGGGATKPRPVTITSDIAGYDCFECPSGPDANQGRELLTACGFIPGMGEACDLADGGVSLYEGDYEGAALSLAAMIPFAGWAAGAAKLKRLNDLARACSFSAATLVLLADGTTKPINEVEVGDQVLATNPETGEQGPRTVTHLWIHNDTLVNLELSDGDTVTTTEDHPFWNHTDQQWQRADTLDTGDQLLAADGRHITVVGLDWTTTQLNTAYNLTVADIHTYYVIVGDIPVLVHNTGGMDGCSDAAYQGVLHIREEIAREGTGGSHSWAARMSDDQLADYLDGFVTRGGGHPFKDGATGWYDADRGVAIIQRGEYSMTGYRMSYEDFLRKLK